MTAATFTTKHRALSLDDLRLLAFGQAVLIKAREERGLAMLDAQENLCRLTGRIEREAAA